MATVNSVGVGLSGASGTGAFAGTTSATLVTPTLGAASATSINFSSTSGIIGTTTNNNAAAGSVGEYITSNVGPSTVNLTSGTIADVTTISLTAGDWNIYASLSLFGGATTTPTFVKAWVSTSSATDPGAPNYASQFPTGTPFATAPYDFTVPFLRVSLASPGTVYLSVQALFAISTCTAGGSLSARRDR